MVNLFNAIFDLIMPYWVSDRIDCVGMVASQALASPKEASTDDALALTEENVEAVLDEVRPYLMSDGGDVELCEIDGLIVKLRLKGACGSCPSSMMTMKMGIERKLMEKIPEIIGVEQVMDQETGLELNEENIEKVS
jgi:Fe-S cluster biogenesis protein NfuA